jgi:hypothetical protein
VKERLQFTFALAILAAWLFVVFKATADPALVPLATVISPVILLPAGWLFTDGYLRSRRRGRKKEDDEDAPD